jgi:hypothetical protein
MSKATATGRTAQGKRRFSQVSLAEALRHLAVDEIETWLLPAPERPASMVLQEYLKRLGQTFDLRSSESARTAVIDALLTEITPEFTQIRIWKEASITGNEFTGVADYVVASRRDYLHTPLLCAVEAKRDDFEAGLAQCLIEMYTCRQNNLRDGFHTPLYGIVTNAVLWRFYHLPLQGAVMESQPFAAEPLAVLLGALHHVLAACHASVLHTLRPTTEPSTTTSH